MPDLRFLLSARWIGFGVFVVALAGVCIWLGQWQFDKLDDKGRESEQAREHLAADPVPLDEVVAAGESVTEADQWRVVTVQGEYDVEHEVTVKYLTRGGRAGVDVLTPLVLADGSAVVVNRGFLETPRVNERPDELPAPPEGPVEVTAWLRVNSGATGDAVRVHEGQVRAISSTGLAESVPHDLRDGYLNLREQTPSAAEPLEREPEPDLGQGPHFFYGLQWWFFAALALVGFVWFARAERIERREQLAGTEATEDAEAPAVTPG